jgi:hypothetical protein
MPTLETPSRIPPELMSELQERAERAAQGIIDSGARLAARARIDRMREDFRRRHGEVIVAVDLIREVRGGS